MSFAKSGWGRFNRKPAQVEKQADSKPPMQEPPEGGDGPSPSEPPEPEKSPKPQEPVIKKKEKSATATAVKTERDTESDQLRVKIHRRLIEEIDTTQLNDIEPFELKKQIREAVNQLLLEENALLTSSDRERLVDEILDETMGLGPLEPLLREETISEVMVNGPKQVFIERKGNLHLTDVQFKDDQHLLQIIDRIVSRIGRRVDESSPLCDARLQDGSRVNVIIPPLALDGPSVTIRKFSADPFKVHDLINFGTLSEMAADLLRACVYSRFNIIISGGTGSGKTTLLNVTSSFIPHDERIVTIEDAAELQLQQEHVVRLETRPPNIEGKGEITMRDLVKNSLRMRPDRIVVGEVRSGEALDMLQAMNTGHDGSLTTVHSNSARDCIRRLETLVMMAGYDLPQRAIREQIASAVDVIIQVSRLSDGSRRILSITEIVGMEGEVVLLQDIFQFEQTGIDENGKFQGSLKYTGIRPKFIERLIAHGADLDMSIFESF